MAFSAGGNLIGLSLVQGIHGNNMRGRSESDGGYLLGMGHPRSKKVVKQIDLVGTMSEGAHLNKLAAMATAIVVLLQALATGAGALAERQQNSSSGISIGTPVLWW